MFESWPFTNFHDLNLDWIIQTLKTYTEKVDALYKGGLYDYVEKVLTAHPEWTTTVMDGAISNKKLAAGVGDCWVDSIGFETEREDQTDRYVATVPAVDGEGNTILPTVGAEHTPITPAVYARQIGSTFTGNVGCSILTTSDTHVGGAYINEGQILQASTAYGAVLADNDCGYIAINEDRTWTTYNIQVAPETMVQDGIQYAFPYWFRLVENSTALDLTGTTAGTASENIIDGCHPRSAVGFAPDNSIIYFACTGRTFDQKGMTAAEVADKMVALGCVSAFMMDGGGSTSFSYKCAKINPNIDSNGTVDRMVRGSLSFVKPDVNRFMADAFAFTGQIRQLTYVQLRRFANYWHNYFTDNLNPVIVHEDPLQLAIDQNLAIRAYLYVDQNNQHPEYDYNLFISLKSGGQRQLIRFDTRDGMYTNHYNTNTWTGWKGRAQCLAQGSAYPGTVAAGNTETYSVNLDYEARTANYSVTLTQVNSSANVFVWVTARTTTSFTYAIKNNGSAAVSPGIEWTAVTFQ